MDAKMRTPDALRCVAANIELYYKKSAPNGAWCIAACRNAAEQFESLQSENKNLNDRVSQKESWEMDMYQCAQKEIQRLRGQLAESQRRERAAVEDILVAVDKGRCVVCKYHKGDGLQCEKWPDRSCWEWRGPAGGRRDG